MSDDDKLKPKSMSEKPSSSVASNMLVLAGMTNLIEHVATVGGRVDVVTAFEGSGRFCWLITKN